MTPKSAEAKVEIDDETLCWYMRFADTAQACANTARWHKPSGSNSFIRASRWCDVHKHSDDVLLPVADDD